MSRLQAVIKKLMTQRQIRYGSNALLVTIAVIGIVVLLNIIGMRYHVRYDLTRTGQFSLSKQTLDVLERLDQDVEMIGFFQEGSYQKISVQDLLTEYAFRSDKVSVKFVDPDKNPALAKQYEINAYGTTVVMAGERQKRVLLRDLYSYPYGGQGPAQFKGEQVFTRALLDLTTESQDTVYFLTGHEEKSLDKDYLRVRQYLEGEGYRVLTLNLASAGSIPEDCSLLVIGGPRRPLDEQEAKAVESYLDEGGSLFVLIDPVIKSGQEPEQLKQMLAAWGLIIDRNVVVDPGSHYFIDPLSPIPQYEPHDITQELIEAQLGMVLPQSRSISASEKPSEEITLSPLFKTTQKSWGETDFTAKKLSFDPDQDAKGPLTLGWVAEHTGKKGARLVVIGNSAFLDNDVLTFQGNVDFFMNATNWLLGKKDMITIRPKSPDFEQVRLTNEQTSLIFYGTVVAMPVVFVILGGMVWMGRRNL